MVESHFYIFRQETKAQARDFIVFNNSRDSVKAFVDKSSMIEITIFLRAHERRRKPTRSANSAGRGGTLVGLLGVSAQSLNFQARLRCCKKTITRIGLSVTVE